MQDTENRLILEKKETHDSMSLLSCSPHNTFFVRDFYHTGEHTNKQKETFSSTLILRRIHELFAAVRFFYS